MIWRSGSELPAEMRSSESTWTHGGRMSAAGERSARNVVCGRVAADNGRCVGTIIRTLSLLLFVILLITPEFLLAATPAGTTISNTATASFTVSGKGPFTKTSNSVALVTRSAATIELLKYAPSSPTAVPASVPLTSYQQTDGSSAPQTALPATMIQPLPLLPATLFHGGEYVFIRVIDPDQNRNAAAVDTVIVTVSSDAANDTETLILFETDQNSGVFVGYLPTSALSASIDGDLHVVAGSRITASYADPSDGSDVVTAAALVDPFGIVFDTSTGLPITGASVVLLNADGSAATIYDDDGVTPFPNVLVTTADGRYRFPFIVPGDYKLKVTPPAGYAAPSTVTTTQIQALPGAPFALAEPGSRGEVFTVNPGPALHIDLPVDPVASGLWIRKTANKETVAVGDFILYTLTIENLNTLAPAPGVIISDKLPLGFRYRRGSTSSNGTATPDPVIDSTGRGLTFTLGTLPASSRTELTYVVEVAAGTRIGNAVNRATASDTAGNVSNSAAAAVTVKEDLLRSKAYIAGTVFGNNCNTPDNDQKGVEGVRIFLEDGTYAITDEKGMYHFEGIDPGVHVVQLDLDTLPYGYEIRPCEENTRFAGRSFSQFVDIEGGTLWRADFYAAPKPPPVGTITLGLSTSVSEKTGDYRITLENSKVPLSNLRLTIILPEGSRYLKGTSTLEGNGVEDPQIFDTVLTYRLGDVPAEWTGDLRLMSFFDDNGPSRDLPARAMLTFDTPAAKNLRTAFVETLCNLKEEKNTSLEHYVLRPHFPPAVAELQEEDKQELDSIVESLQGMEIRSIRIAGHTDNRPVTLRYRHIFADNFALSSARARSVATYLSDRLDLREGQITTSGFGDTLPIADNRTADGRRLNRRVELFIDAAKTVRTASIDVSKPESDPLRHETVGMSPAFEKPTPPVEHQEQIEPPTQMPEYDRNWLMKTEPGNRWLWPSRDTNPDHPSTKVAIQHATDLKPTLFVNGRQVDAVHYDGTQTAPNNLSVSFWIAVKLIEGENLFEIILKDKTGEEKDRLSHTVYYASEPVSAELVPEKTRLIADGITPPVVAVRLFDKNNKPVRKGRSVEFSVTPPHAPARKSLEQAGGLLPSAPVESDGIALLCLEPTTRSGKLRTTVHLSGKDIEIDSWLDAPLRDWILVGFAQGTAGYSTLSGSKEDLNATEAEDDFYRDGRVKFYAKGKVKGKWLLTVAYDSDKEKLKGESLHQIIDPDAYYTLYGDGTEQRYDTASAEKLYVKLEREKFYALFGDFETGLTVTELLRYSRSLTGLKAELNADRLKVNVFASDTGQAFVKDEIRGDGTSGLYNLSRKDLVINSEKVTIETRDRFHSETVLTSRHLSRHIDYDIDYDADTLFFKEPVYSKDEDFNPVYIVVDYEARSKGDESLNYGGRAAVKPFDENIEIGASYIHEEGGLNKGDLQGLDTTIKLTDATLLKGEIASTRTENAGQNDSGRAYLAEVTHKTEQLDARAYIREQTGDFGLGQQKGSETATRKYGASARYHLSKSFSLNGEGYRERNLATGAEREVIEGKTSWKYSSSSFGLGLRQATDRMGDGSTRRSTQGTTGISWSASERLTLRAGHEQALWGSAENSDYPTRTTLGADLKLSETATLVAEQEFTQGEDEDTEGTRIGLKTTPWKDAEINTGIEQQIGENGTRLFANLGLRQKWQISERWSIDAGFDRSHTLKHPGNPAINVNVPPASGTESDFTAISLGANRKAEKWTWSNRVEYRHSEADDKWNILSGLAGEVREGFGLSAKMSLTRAESSAGSRQTGGDLRLGLAWRPSTSRWIVLDRLDLITDRLEGGSGGYNNWRIVNNLNANWKPTRKIQIALQYGAKYVEENIAGQSYDSVTDLYGVETRYDLSSRWDVGLHGNALHSWNGGSFDFRSGASVGCNVVENMWVSLGYNFTGFRDADFSRSDFTAQGPFLRFRVKFDQQTARDVTRWLKEL